MAPTRILVSVDDSPSGRAALRWAAGYARLDNGEVIAVVPARHAAFGLPPDPALVPSWRASEDAAQRSLVEALQHRLRSDRVPGVVHRGRAGRAASLYAAARTHQPDLTVLGAGDGALGALIAGATAALVRRATRSPVQVVRPAGGDTPRSPSRRSATQR